MRLRVNVARLLAGAVAVTLAVAACASPETGKVTKRNYSGPWTEYQQRCSFYDTKGVCAAYTPVYIPHDEECSLYLVNDDRHGWREVPCSEYDHYTVGDHYPKER